MSAYQEMREEPGPCVLLESTTSAGPSGLSSPLVSGMKIRLGTAVSHTPPKPTSMPLRFAPRQVIARADRKKEDAVQVGEDPGMRRGDPERGSEPR